MTPEELARLRRARDLMDRESYSYLTTRAEISRSLGLPSSCDGPDLVHYLRSARRVRLGTGTGDS